MHLGRLLSRRAVVVIVLIVSAIFGIAWFAAPPQHASGPATTVKICGSTIEVRFEGETTSAKRDDLLNWIRRAGDAVCTYYGKFPVPHLTLDVHVRGGSGVHGGVTYP